MRPITVYPNAAPKVIINTHAYLNTSGLFNTYACSDTRYIYENLALDHNNVYFMLCGHVSGEYRVTDWFDERPVHQLLSDYQNLANGGNGWLRIMRFSPANNRVFVDTYSPSLNDFYFRPSSRFFLELSMTVFPVVMQLAGVNSAQQHDIVWDGMEPDTAYEWYVQVTL